MIEGEKRHKNGKTQREIKARKWRNRIIDRRQKTERKISKEAYRNIRRRDRYGERDGEKETDRQTDR